MIHGHENSGGPDAGIKFEDKHVLADPQAEKDRRIVMYSSQMGQSGLHTRRVEFSFGAFARPVLCVETDERFQCVSAAAKALNIKPGNIRQAIRSGQRTGHPGRKWHFKYVPDSPPAKVSNGRERAVRCITTGDQFESITAAARAHGIHTSSLFDSIKFGRPTRHKRVYEYLKAA